MARYVVFVKTRDHRWETYGTSGSLRVAGRLFDRAKVEGRRWGSFMYISLVDEVTRVRLRFEDISPDLYDYAFGPWD